MNISFETWLPPEKIVSHHCEKYLQALLLKLTKYVRITMSLLHNPKPCAYISLKIGCFELGDYYDLTVTSYLGCWYLLWYV